MKNLAILIYLLLILVSCGRNAVVHKDYDSRFKNLEDRITYLEERLYNILDQIDSVSYSLNQLDSNLTDKLYLMYNQLVNKINQGDASVQSQIENLNQVLDSITLNSVEIVDPCGNDDLSQEVIMIMPDGSLLALYSSGNNVYLSKLSDGKYKTTDARKCKFEVLNGIII